MALFSALPMEMLSQAPRSLHILFPFFFGDRFGHFQMNKYSHIFTSLFSQVFFPYFSRILSYISQMNEPRGWTFLCIWYESRGFRVYEVKRHCFSFYMALCMPIHLRQRTSRVYQDHLHLCRVLTSFVPPVHNQGVSLAPLQGHALWKIFLPTTGSFFFKYY